MKSLIVIIVFLISASIVSQAQDSNLSYLDIRKQIDDFNVIFKKQKIADEMYIQVDESGQRWILIKKSDVTGNKNDEYDFCKSISNDILKMLHSSVNYNLEKPISIKEFTSIMSSKGIQGFEFFTNKFEHYYKWIDLIEK